MDAMKSRTILYLGLAVLCLTVGAGSRSEGLERGRPPSIRYTVEVDEQEFAFLRVSMDVENVTAGPLTFRLPRWAPGAYRIRDYAENVRQLHAVAQDGSPLAVQRVAEDGWQVRARGELVRVEYEVEPAYETWRGRALDSTHALIEGPDVFLYLEGHKEDPVQVSYHLPDGWRITSALDAVRDSTVYVADNYDALIDAPTEMGLFRRYRVYLGEKPVDLVFRGADGFAADSFAVMVKKICAYETGLFGETPFDKYVFFYNVFPGRRSGGGLEHRNSTVIGLAGTRLAQSVLSAAEVTAHEFFHLWNVKRIRPAVLGPFDYTREVRTRDLWFSEGVTSYYEGLTLVRSGLWTVQRLLRELAFQVERHQEAADRRNVSVEQVSWNIWERGYGHAGVSYYVKGLLLGWLLDLQMRHVTDNRVSLDDLMRFMNEHYARQNKGFRHGDIQRAVEELTGRDFSDFFRRYVAGTEDLPYREVLGYAGLDFFLSSRWLPDIGRVFFLGPRHRVVLVQRGSAAEQAGLQAGDYLLAVEGERITTLAEFKRMIEERKVGSTIKLRVRRGDEELVLPVTVAQREDAQCVIEPKADPTETEHALLVDWLTGRVRGPSSHGIPRGGSKPSGSGKL